MLQGRLRVVVGVGLRLLGRVSELGVIPQALSVRGRVPVGERLG